MRKKMQHNEPGILSFENLQIYGAQATFEVICRQGGKEICRTTVHALVEGRYTLPVINKILPLPKNNKLKIKQRIIGWLTSRSPLLRIVCS